MRRRQGCALSPSPHRAYTQLTQETVVVSTAHALLGRVEHEVVVELRGVGRHVFVRGLLVRNRAQLRVERNVEESRLVERRWCRVNVRVKVKVKVKVKAECRVEPVGVVWCGMAWFGAAQIGVAWCGVALCDVVGAPLVRSRHRGRPACPRRRPRARSDPASAPTSPKSGAISGPTGSPPKRSSCG